MLLRGDNDSPPLLKIVCVNKVVSHNGLPNNKKCITTQVDFTNFFVKRIIQNICLKWGHFLFSEICIEFCYSSSEVIYTFSPNYAYFNEMFLSFGDMCQA